MSESAAGESPLLSILAASQRDKRGVEVTVNGQSIGMLVTKIGDEFVEGKSQQYTRIVVRLASVQAVAMF